MLFSVIIPLLAAFAAPWLARRLGPNAGWPLAVAPLLSAVPMVRSLPLGPGAEVLERADWLPELGVESDA